MEIDNEVFNIDTTSEKFFDEYLMIKKPLLEYILSKLNNKPITLNPKLLHVFSLLLHYNNQYRNMENGDKWKIIFDNGTRKTIADKLNINLKHLNTYISILRNIKILNGKTINKPFIVYPDNEFSLIYKFNIKDE
jgi:hypothetical protein